MTDPQPSNRTLIDPHTGREVMVIYAYPPQVQDTTAEVVDGTSPAELIGRLIAGWKAIAAVTALAAVIGLAIALTTPNRYTASATALPPPEKGGGGGMMAQYAGLAAAAGIQLPGAQSSSVDAIMAILNSRRLQEPLIDQFQLRAYYQATTRDDVLKAFAQDFSARNDKKSNTITLAVTNRDPQRAADIANAAADNLRSIYNEISQGTAGRERAFLEIRLKETEASLLKASQELAEFKTAKGAIEIESQTKATVEAVAKLQGELISQQIELKAVLAAAASPDNPRVQLLQEKINAMTAELQRLLGTGGDGPGVLLGLGSLPELSIAYIERFRAVKKHEAVLAALTTQLESARINEVRTSEVVTIVDRAFVPERKSGPARAQTCIAATLLGGLAGCAMVLLGPGIRRLRREAMRNAA